MLTLENSSFSTIQNFVNSSVLTFIFSSYKVLSLFLGDRKQSSNENCVDLSLYLSVYLTYITYFTYLTYLAYVLYLNYLTYLTLPTYLPIHPSASIRLSKYLDFQLSICCLSIYTSPPAVEYVVRFVGEYCT
jgi:hypothetical protein